MYTVFNNAFCSHGKLNKKKENRLQNGKCMSTHYNLCIVHVRIVILRYYAHMLMDNNNSTGINTAM